MVAELISLGALALSVTSAWLALRNRSDSYAAKLFEKQVALTQELWDSVATTMSAIDLLAHEALSGASPPRRTELHAAAFTALGKPVESQSSFPHSSHGSFLGRFTSGTSLRERFFL